MRRPALRFRLLLGTIVVAVGAVAATAWLSARSTTTSIQQQEDSVSSAYPVAYEGVVDYAATHTEWSSAGPMLAGLEQQLGVGIVVTPVGARPIGSSPAARGRAAGATPSVAIDPLTVDNALAGTRFPDGIDPRTLGPFLLTPQEHADLEALVESAETCLEKHGADAGIAEVDSGRPYLRVPQAGAPGDCRGVLKAGDNLVGFEDSSSVTPTATERSALKQLAASMKTCSGRHGAVRLALSARGEVTTEPPGDPGLHRCLVEARRQLLRPYVAPAAYMKITPLGQDTPVRVGLPWAGTLRIAGAAAVIAALAIGVAMLLANRVIRPVHALTEAARRMRAGDNTARAPATPHWEIAELAAAFNEMAEHAARTDRQRKDLISDISHDLRTPLGTIRGWLVAAHDGVADLDADLVSSLLEETELLQRLVDDLRDLALADAGQLRLDLVELNVGDLLRHVAATAGGRASVEAPADLFLVADPVRLRQAVGNLVANAERHTPPGGRITLRAHRTGGRVVVDVADTGPGIPAEDLAHVFDRFWRADKSRSRRTGGSGLGLAIVRQLVEAHGGEVEVASTLGSGSTFTLRLPVTKEPS